MIVIFHISDRELIEKTLSPEINTINFEGNTLVHV